MGRGSRAAVKESQLFYGCSKRTTQPDVDSLHIIAGGEVKRSGRFLFRTMDGVLHCQYGPAFEIGHQKVYYLNGKKHRFDGPAWIRGDGQHWYLEGVHLPEPDPGQAIQLPPEKDWIVHAASKGGVKETSPRYRLRHLLESETMDYEAAIRQLKEYPDLAVAERYTVDGIHYWDQAAFERQQRKIVSAEHYGAEQSFRIYSAEALPKASLGEGVDYAAADAKCLVAPGAGHKVRSQTGRLYAITSEQQEVSAQEAEVMRQEHLQLLFFRPKAGIFFDCARPLPPAPLDSYRYRVFEAELLS